MLAATRLLGALCFAIAAGTAAQTGPKPGESRGELLDSTYCVACHTAQVHWRGRKLVTDWASLNAQVRRWQDNAALHWGDDEIGDVARYLNTLHYHFEPPADRALLPGRPAGARG